MKKAILFLTFLFCFSLTNAQNYQCLQSGVKHYFVNGNGYLRGIRIDSTITLGDTTVYYPFHTPRGAYDDTTHLPNALDTNGGSWLGKKVLQKGDGTFLFDNYWNDSVIIKTQANIGDSWVFYSDISSLYYKATVVNIDTMTVLGAIDSVKTIMITANNGAGIVANDALDSFNIILSKNNGFVQVSDLYTFPYHKPDSAYRPGLDFYLDRSTFSNVYVNSYGGNSPTAAITLFTLVNFINPSDQQLRNWNLGDILSSYHWYGQAPFHSDVSETITSVVTNKVVAAHTTDYVLTGSTGTCSYPGVFITCHFICSDGSYTFYDSVYPIIDTNHMPEESSYTGSYIFYFPNDSMYHSIAPAYTLVTPCYAFSGLGGFRETANYKLGIGMTYYYEIDGNPEFESTTLSYFPVSVDNLHQKTLSYQIFPNPATDELTINTTSALPYTITLQNVLGQTVQTTHTTKQQQTINVSNLPAGVYNVCITDEGGNRYNDKVVIVH